MSGVYKRKTWVATAAVGICAALLFLSFVTPAIRTATAATASSQVSSSPFAMSVDTTSDTLWVTDNTLLGNVYIYQITSGILSSSPSLTLTASDFPGGTVFTPAGIAYDPYYDATFIADYRDGIVYMVTVSPDLSSFNIESISLPTGATPVGIAIDPLNDLVYVTDSFNGNVYIIDPNSLSIVGQVSVGGTPTSLVYSIQNYQMYVGIPGLSSTVTPIDTLTQTVGTPISVSVSPLPSALTYDDQNGQIYVAPDPLFGPNNVSVIDASNNVVGAVINVGVHPQGVAYANSNDAVYVTNYGSNTVSVIDASTNMVFQTLSVGSEPGPIVYDSVDSFVAVGNMGSNTVTTFSTAPSGLQSITESFTALSSQISTGFSDVQTSISNLSSQISTGFTNIQNSLNKLSNTPQQSTASGETTFTTTSTSATIFAFSGSKLGQTTVSLGTSGVTGGEKITINYYTDPSSTSTYIQKTVTSGSDVSGFTDNAAAWKVVIMISYPRGQSNNVVVNWAVSGLAPPS